MCPSRHPCDSTYASTGDTANGKETAFGAISPFATEEGIERSGCPIRSTNSSSWRGNENHWYGRPGLLGAGACLRSQPDSQCGVEVSVLVGAGRPDPGKDADIVIPAVRVHDARESPPGR